MREHLLMDPQWKFHRGDIADSGRHGYLYPYMHTKTERGQGPAAMDYNDFGWETVDLPHDYVVLGKPDPKELTNFGCLKRENAWYRKFFRLEPEDCKKRITIVFDGICTKSRIWVNGCDMALSTSGYTGFEVDISDIARYGDDLNIVSVHVDLSEYEGWWYEGGGIYRHVWLNKTARLAVDRNGVWVHPREQADQIWSVPVETTVRNDTFEPHFAEVEQAIYTAEGKKIASSTERVCLKPREKTAVIQEMTVRRPLLWSDDTPNLYTLQTVIRKGGELQDETDTTFGFRTILFDPDKGFFLNGVSKKIRGMCMHEDHGGLGVALPDSVKAFRVRRLKEMGCNGYRFSHNPHSTETLDACDRQGMLVMDENRWFLSTPDELSRLEETVRRDRNHPSVILWSMGNEEFLQARETGRRIMAAMRACVRKLDDTRPVTMAMHTGLLEHGAADVCDVIGMNYNITLCGQIHKRHPDKAILFSECQSTEESEDALGDRRAGMRTWEIVSELPYVCGMFAWTGMSYRGEHDFPNLFAPCGAMDQNGYPNYAYYYYRACWSGQPMAYIQPYWNQSVPVGTELTVRVFTTGDEITLFLNGKKLGTKPSSPFYQSDWKVPYEPGELRAVATRRGKPEAEFVRRTTGTVCALRVVAENADSSLSERDAVVFSIYAVDKQGDTVPDADAEVRFHAEGGRILAAENGDITDQPDRANPSCRLYHGICQVIVRPVSEKAVTLTAECGTLPPSTAAVPTGRLQDPASVPGESSRYVNLWQVSDWLAEKPAMGGGIPLHKAEVGHGTVLHDLTLNSGYLLYHGTSYTPECLPGERLLLQFELVEGTAEISAELFDGDKKVAGARSDKNYPEPDKVCLAFDRTGVPLRAEIWVALGITQPFDGVTKAVRWEKSRT